MRGKTEKREGWKCKKNGRSKSKNRSLKCFHCHKDAHFKRDCSERKKKSKESKDRNGNAAVVFHNQEEGYDSAGILLASSNQTEGK